MEGGYIAVSLQKMVNILVEHTDTVGTATNSGDIYFSIYLPCCYFYGPKIPSHLPITLIFDELKQAIKLHQKGVKQIPLSKGITVKTIAEGTTEIKKSEDLESNPVNLF